MELYNIKPWLRINKYVIVFFFSEKDDLVANTKVENEKSNTRDRDVPKKDNKLSNLFSRYGFVYFR